MAKLPHRGIDLATPSGAHLHSGSKTSLTNTLSSYLNPPIDKKLGVTIQSPGTPAINIVATDAILNQTPGVNPFLIIDLSNEEMNRLMGGGAELVQFTRDQIDNYEDDVSEEFAKGYRAALEVLMGDKVLEEYLGE